jgi:para-nitrobenzyl esterase
MISSAADEGSGFVATWTVKTVADFADYVRQEFGPDADEVLKAYAPTQVSQVPQALAQVFGDSQFGVGARGIARAMAPSGVYRSTFTRKAGGVRPAVHGSDTAYPFGNVPEAATDPIDRAVSEAMMNALVRFMHTGSPNGDGLPAWPRWTPTGNQEMEFGDAPRVRVRPDSPGVVTLATIMERRSAVWGRR